MKLIDKYVAEVGKHLPRKNREDIEAEIRSTLEDMLDERKSSSGSLDEATVIEVLRNYGPPQEVASRYQSHQPQYLIGPRLFPIFVLVTRVVFTVLIALSLIGLGTDLVERGSTAAGFLSSLIDWGTGIFNALIVAFGNIALVLAILERVGLGCEVESEKKEWDPRELYNTPDPDQIDPPDHIATIIFTFLGLAILNLYPNLIAIHVVNNGTQTSIPIFTETFFRFLPWINIVSLILIGFNAYMLYRKVWTTATRILSILIDLATATLSIIVLRTAGILGITPEALTAAGLSGSAQELARLANAVPTLIIIIILVVTVIKLVVTVRRLLQGQPASPYPMIKS